MNRIEPENIRSLADYLPRLDAEAASIELSGTEYQYPEVIEEFFELVQSQFADFDTNVYDRWMQVSRRSATSIDEARLEECRIMLVHIARAERFCEGAWLAVIRLGRVQAILRRLEVISREA